jgi:Mrp family chromosome partitioning ATPase
LPDNLPDDPGVGNGVIRLSSHLGLWVWQVSKTAEENRVMLAEVVAAHRTKYDLILLDGGSVTESPLSEFYEFWNQTKLNGVVLVSNTKRSPEVPVSHIVGRLRQHPIRLIGITENWV